MADLEYWVQLVIAICPAIIAVIGVISALGVAVRKISANSSESLTATKNVSKVNENLQSEMGQIIKDNEELRSQIKEINAKLDNVHVSKKR